jgi:hypothetical protein
MSGYDFRKGQPGRSSPDWRSRPMKSRRSEELQSNIPLQAAKKLGEFGGDFSAGEFRLSCTPSFLKEGSGVNRICSANSNDTNKGLISWNLYQTNMLVIALMIVQSTSSPCGYPISI